MKEKGGKVPPTVLRAQMHLFRNLSHCPKMKKTYRPEHPINIPSNVNNIFFPEFLSLAFYFY